MSDEREVQKTWCIFCGRSSNEVAVMLNQKPEVGDNGLCDACVWVAVRRLLAHDMKQMVMEVIQAPPQRPTRLNKGDRDARE